MGGAHRAPPGVCHARGGLRFVFYGRVSTEDWQDPVTSRARQRDRYLLAGLRACGTCGRRLESAWSIGKPAYRCRHGYTSAGSTPGRPANLHVREDQILPRLAALAILHADGSHSLRTGEHANARVTTPAQAADLIDRLQTADITLIYDPATPTLRDGTRNWLAVTAG